MTKYSVIMAPDNVFIQPVTLVLLDTTEHFVQVTAIKYI